MVHRVGEGPGTWAMGSLFEHLVTSGETGGSFAMSLVTQPPGIATPLHRHTKEAEAVFVLGGQIEYRAGEETYDLTEGSFLYLPLGLPHAFRIRGDEPARFLGLTAPGGLMGLYDEVGVPAAGMHIPAEGEGRSMRGGDRPLERGRPALRAPGRRPTPPGVAPVPRIGGLGLHFCDGSAVSGCTSVTGRRILGGSSDRSACCSAGRCGGASSGRLDC